MAKTRGVYFGGVPVEPDRKKLRDKWPHDQLAIGTVISHDEVEEVLNTEGDCHRKSSRYHTVTQSWIKELERIHGIVLKRSYGIGFKVLSPSERVDRCSTDLTSGFRKIRTCYTRISDVPRTELNQEDGKRADHISHIASATLSHQRQLARGMKPARREIATAEAK